MRKEQDQETWISVADLMAGLAIVFIAFASYALVDKSKAIEAEFCAILQRAQDDLARNNIEIGSCTQGRVNLVFDSKEMQFQPGKAELPPRLEEALDQTIPGVLEAIRENRLNPHIESFVVEGHTSDEWFGPDQAEAYWNNMGLSQARALSVLRHIREDIIRFQMETSERKEVFCHMRQIGSASGLSSRNPILRDNGAKINRTLSRRIEIVILTEAEPQDEQKPRSALKKLCEAEWEYDREAPPTGHPRPDEEDRGPSRDHSARGHSPHPDGDPA